MAQAQFPMVPAWSVVDDAFTPAWIDSIAVWYDATDLGVMEVSGDTMYAWLDKSGNSRHAYQLASASKPVFSDSSGIKYVLFDGVDDALVGPVLPSSSGYTIFIVSRTYTRVGTQIAYHMGNTGINGYGMLHYGQKVAVLHGGRSLKVGAVANTLNREIWSARHSTGGTTMTVNADTLVGINDLTVSFSTPTTQSSIGSNEVNNAPFRGWIAEIIVYSRRLTPTEWLQVYTYLSSKWAIP